jgi:hypothetical protein
MILPISLWREMYLTDSAGKQIFRIHVKLAF